MKCIYIDEKGTQESFKISSPFNWKEKLAYGAETMHGYLLNGWEISEDNVSDFEREFLELEDKYFSKFQGERKELKGSNLLSRQFSYGVASMKEREIDFYIALIKLSLKYNASNVLFSINKMSTIVNARLQEWIYTLDEKRICDNPYLLKYSLTKFFDLESSEQMMETLLDNNKSTKELLYKIQEEMQNFINTHTENKRVKFQIEEYKKIIKVIKSGKSFAKNTTSEIKFDWTKVTYAIDSWLREREYLLCEKPNNIKCYLDQGIPEEPFICNDFNYVKSNCDSKDSVGIRVTDCLVAIAGSYIKKLREDTIYDPNEPKKTKHLSIKWFELTKKQFELVNLLKNIFFDGNKYSYIGDTYFDNEENFRALVEYICSYPSYYEYEQVPSEEHQKRQLKQYAIFSINLWQNSKNFVGNIRNKYGSFREAERQGITRIL